MIEIWKPILGYEGLYEVSNLGKIKSLKQIRTCWNGYKIIRYEIPEKILSLRIRSNYLAVGLTKNKKQMTYTVHRLVAETFIENPDNLPCVNHKDENKLNNCIDNLEWCTYQYNNAYGSRTTKTCKLVKCVETGVIYNSVVEASKQTGIARPNILLCCKKSNRTAKGFHWVYVNDLYKGDTKPKKEEEKDG